MRPHSVISFIFLSAASAAIAQSSSGATCLQDPAGWASSCLQSANTATSQGCSSTDTECLCDAFRTNGNFGIFDLKCVSDGCINEAAPSSVVESAFSAAVTAQSSICAPYTSSATATITQAP
ncbi:hypothetical protein EW146_g9243 [Bondarzewia mesenterica]|uniref:CFEM domain-containing protein n=1 Tax=Bondarzewia mesenterica TaxID=1095465 RepID=A0A4S4L7U8_9AGAM|nr:hypothetical protein EW146_g9243 [Bondarzewia mesenterica]